MSLARNLRTRSFPASLRLPVLALLLLVTQLALLFLATTVWRQEQGVSVRVVGPEEIVFDWSRDACEPNDVPDTPARAFRDAAGRVQLIASHYINRRMTGPDLDHVRHDCRVILSSHNNPDPAGFDDREWIHSLYTLDGAQVVALLHNEYQGHRHPGQCSSGEYRRCWYNSITHAVSEDGGKTFRHSGPPEHLVASLPYRYVPDSGPAGVFNPSNIVHNSRDGYYYALLHVEEYRDQQWGTCVMRTRDVSDRTSWRAWDGSGFNVRFVDPYRERSVPENAHVCHPVAREHINMHSSVTFNTYLGRFILVGTSQSSEDGRTAAGIYYSLSDDLVHWTPKKLLLEVEFTSTFSCGDQNPVNYPSLLDPDSTSRNFETADRTAYLYLTRFNYHSCRQSLDRDLVRLPVEFSLP